MKVRFAPKQSGFTLVELLVALAIFAIMAVMSYRTLDSVFQTRQHLNTETARLRDVALLFARLDDDFTTLLDRRPRNADNLLDDALRLTALLPGADDATLVFTRSGFAGSTGIAATPQRVGYRLKEGTLELVLWPSLDAAPRTAPQAYPALGQVREAKWRAMDRAGTWQNVWRSTPVGGSPASGAASAPGAYPAALELTITLAGGEQFVRVFALRGNT
ncbi:MAG: type II secretion system minor pseudopilin GspJ [Betaproteobacteria bacterium]|nr:type II secretion system minor pseudopilin GspJ [Betaproteobacteria bacterium]